MINTTGRTCNQIALRLRRAARELDDAAKLAETLPGDDLLGALGDLTEPIAADLRSWAESYSLPDGPGEDPDPTASIEAGPCLLCDHPQTRPCEFCRRPLCDHPACVAVHRYSKHRSL